MPRGPGEDPARARLRERGNGAPGALGGHEGLSWCRVVRAGDEPCDAAGGDRAERYRVDLRPGHRPLWTGGNGTTRCPTVMRASTAGLSASQGDIEPYSPP
ncbi:hypothetical protein Afil01_57150 [Actinorhabdospora filicis]|uniref:Uncharacterized protein n=1 Tax=Actinorhabdospora filicis TaxID=1785913 RepID=A0A9W6SRS8_9ACTN|nr:hypothetical protein Afil01_57150 [Actinorhabdospora filicis]